MNNESQGIEQHELVIPGRQGGERIDDRRSVKDNHEKHVPDHGKVAELDIKRRRDEREGKHDHVNKDGEKQKHPDSRQARHESFEREKQSDHQEIHQEDKGGVDRRSQDDRPARHVYLGDQLRLGQKRLHASTRPFGEEIEHHERNEKLQGIGVGAGRTRIEYGREHEVKHRESEQGLEQGPEIAQDAAVVTELEIGLG